MHILKKIQIYTVHNPRFKISCCKLFFSLYNTFCNLKEAEWLTNTCITHQVFIKLKDMICLAINLYHLVMEKLFILTLKFDYHAELFILRRSIYCSLKIATTTQPP